MEKGLSDAPVRYVTLDDEPAKPATKDPREPREIVRPKGYAEFVAKNRQPEPKPPEPTLGQRIATKVKDAASSVGTGLSDAAGWVSDTAKQLTTPTATPDQQASAQDDGAFSDPMGSGVGASVMQQAAPEQPSFIDQASGRSSPPDNPYPSLAPVRPEVRAAFSAQWDAASPDKRLLMLDQPGWIGQLARERSGLYSGEGVRDGLYGQPKSNLTEAGKRFDPRAESRRETLIDKGENQSFAKVAAERGASVGAQPGKEIDALGDVAKPSDFDFETKGIFDPNGSSNGLNRALGRGVSKGALGLVKAATGYGQFLSDVYGLDEAGKVADKGSKWVENKENAIGDHGDRLSRNLEGAISSIAQQLPMIVTGVKAGSEAIPLAGIALTTFSQEYADGKAQGQPMAQRTMRAGIFAAFEVLGEKVGLHGEMEALKKVARGLPSDAIIGFLSNAIKRELPGELFTTTGQFATDKFGPFGIAQKPGSTLDDYLGQMADTFVQTLMQAGVMSAGGGGAATAVKHVNSKGASEGVANAEALAAQDQAMNKWAASPLSGKRPTELRTDALKRFDDLAAEHGLPDDALKAAKDAVAGKPLDQVPAILKRITAAMSRNGLFGKPVAEESLASLDHPEDGPVDASEVLGTVQPAKEVAQDAVQSPVQSPATEAAQEAPQVAAEQPVQPSATAAAIDEAAHGAATSPLNDKPQPTDAQKEAGNYAKGHVTVQGLDIAVENPRGSTRSGTSPEGVKWETTMQHHYGYIKGTVGNDKDHVDTFIGQNPDSQRAFVVDQIDPKTGEFDEHKVVLGADSLDQAREIYQSNYEKGWSGLGAITELPMAAFKSWVKDGAKRAPLGDISIKQQEVAGNEQVRPNPHDQAAQQQAGQAPAAEQGNGAPGAPGQEQGQPARPAAKQGGSSGLNPDQANSEDVPAKVFKTRKAAESHRDSLGNGLRLQKVKGGYKLRAKTDAELAAESKGAQRLKKGAPTNVQGDSLLTAIAKAGGLAMSEKANTITEGNKNAGGKMVFTNDGQPLDIMAQTLAEDGYIPPHEVESDGGVSWLQNAIGEEFGGHAQHFSHSGEEWMRKRADAERGDAPDYDAAGAPDSLLDATGYFDDNAAEQAARDALADANTEASEGAYLEAEDLFWQSLSEVEAQEEEHARQEADQADAQDGARPGSTESPAAGKPQEGDRPAPGDAGQGNAGQPAGKGRGTPVQGEAQEGLTAGTTPKNGKAKPGERLKRVEAHFTPGNIVQSYSGFDRVISFKWDEGRPGSFSVTVQHVVKDGDGWKVDPSDARERTHSTQPGERELKQGAVGRWQEAPLLSAQTEEDLRAKSEREDAAKQQEAARRAADQEKVRQADEARDNKARADATVDDFQLGQSADQQMSGVADLFAPTQEQATTATTNYSENNSSKYKAAEANQKESKPERPSEVIELRKRESVLKSLLGCLQS